MPPLRSVVFIGWAGLRGADSLVIALSLPLMGSTGAPFPGRDLILFLTFAIIFVTLVVQGLSLKAVIRALGLKPDRSSRKCRRACPSGRRRAGGARRVRRRAAGSGGREEGAAPQVRARGAPLPGEAGQQAHHAQRRAHRSVPDDAPEDARRRTRRPDRHARQERDCRRRPEGDPARPRSRTGPSQQPGPSDGGFESAPEILRETRE